MGKEGNGEKEREAVVVDIVVEVVGRVVRGRDVLEVRGESAVTAWIWLFVFPTYCNVRQPIETSMNRLRAAADAAGTRVYSFASVHRHIVYPVRVALYRWGVEPELLRKGGGGGRSAAGQLAIS